MANANLFRSQKGKLLPNANAINFEQAPAYRLPPQQLLAQYAATGCLNATFYASAEAQLDTVLELSKEVDTRFIAQTAIYCRERGYMKDMPALLTAVLAAKGAAELTPVFDRVIDNGKMLRNFVQIIRSGAVGRKSLGTRPKKLVQAWLNTASEKALLSAAVGNTPSLADVVKMVHPKPTEAWREAFFAWLIGKPHNADALPPNVKAFEAYKRDRAQPLPDVPFQMLTALELSDAAWAQIALQGGWQMVRMNLNTFARRGVFQLPGMTEAIAAKLRDAEAIAKARVFPYQLMAAYCSATQEVPPAIREALQDALEIALANVPQIAGKVVVCPDVSGSMSSPVTGYRASASTAVRCIDVAALVAAAMLRKNAGTSVLPFENDVVNIDLNPRDTVMTNAQKLAAIGGGGTNCSAPLALLNKNKVQADLIVFVSDNASWVDATRHGATATMREWETFKQRNPDAKLVCIDIAPYGTTQAAERMDVLNIGGFSDDVFNIVAAFAAGQLSPAHWVGEIGAIGI
ncbi:TROVE domain-containing protein [Noviherbaspirillum cavernae]|uniref:TROVE domain-containing protein n=1 Tax=Noviherbaspirillum cavernae TaxID=2320862 RepID=A0A418WWS5_9BURK|nr:TROVE domain-containing protein [Noviherbaspirillum cavernae]RJG04699.1 TROVE domain-containing protein [Noviherbaspirillum cavernae]